MALYRVRPGFVHGLKDEYKAGDTLDLDSRAAAGFADKLELVEVEPVPTVKQPAAAPLEAVPLIMPAPLFDVGGSTVSAVLAAVDAGLITAVDALAVESGNRNRATLVKALQDLINGAVSE